MVLTVRNDCAVWIMTRGQSEVHHLHLELFHIMDELCIYIPNNTISHCNPPHTIYTFPSTHCRKHLSTELCADAASHTCLYRCSVLYLVDMGLFDEGFTCRPVTCHSVL